MSASVRHRWLFVCAHRTEGLLARELLSDFVPFVTGRPYVRNLDDLHLNSKSGPSRVRLETSHCSGHERDNIERMWSTSDADAQVAYLRRRLEDPTLHSARLPCETVRIVRPGILQCEFDSDGLPALSTWWQWVERSDLPHALQVCSVSGWPLAMPLLSSGRARTDNRHRHRFSRTS